MCLDTHQRQFLYRACRLGMCNGDFVFFYVAHDEETWRQGDWKDEVVKQAYRNVLYVSESV